MMRHARSNRPQIEPVTGALGAEIVGVDLSQPLDDEQFEYISDAFMNYLVLFFREQELTPSQQKAFAARFGDLHIHPNTVSMKDHPEIIEVIKEPDEVGNWGDGWHTDLTAFPTPPLGSVLYALEVPPFSGDTQFSNMYVAYETLSSHMKRLLKDLVCIHVQDLAEYSKFKSMGTIPSQPSRAEHPIVRTHPVTKKKALFLPRRKLGRITGMSEAESDAILNLLSNHAENPDFACRFRWKKNSVAMWDNRCTQHRVTADYFYTLRGFDPHRRHLRRLSIEGDRPV